jgi:hypothetical protein
MVLLEPPAPADRVLVGLALAIFSFWSAAARRRMAVRGPPGGVGDEGRPGAAPVAAPAGTGDEGRGEDYFKDGRISKKNQKDKSIMRFPSLRQLEGRGECETFPCVHLPGQRYRRSRMLKSIELIPFLLSDRQNLTSNKELQQNSSELNGCKGMCSESEFGDVELNRAGEIGVPGSIELRPPSPEIYVRWIVFPDPPIYSCRHP